MHSDDEDVLLCPVRALRMFLKCTHSHRWQCRRLFLPYRTSYDADIMKATIMRWIVSLVNMAYRSALTKLPSNPIRAHEIRAISTSLAEAKGVSLPHIMNATYWRSAITFISYYLRDISAKRGDETFGISRLVVSQTLISL